MLGRTIGLLRQIPQPSLTAQTTEAHSAHRRCRRFFVPAWQWERACFLAGGARRPQGLPVLGPVCQPRTVRHPD
jgi:hypothetical protein